MPAALMARRLRSRLGCHKQAGIPHRGRSANIWPLRMRTRLSSLVALCIAWNCVLEAAEVSSSPTSCFGTRSPIIIEISMADSKKPILHKNVQYSLSEAEKWLSDSSTRFGKVDPVLIVLRQHDPIGTVAALVEIAKKYKNAVYTILLSDSNTPLFTLVFSKADQTSEWDTFIQSYHFPTPSPQNTSPDINKILREPTVSVPITPSQK